MGSRQIARYLPYADFGPPPSRLVYVLSIPIGSCKVPKPLLLTKRCPLVFDEPVVLHSQNEDGRHWLTIVEMPSIQLWPVAANHCRVGHFLAKIIVAKLARLEAEPFELMLTRADVAEVRSLASFPELDGEAADVHLVLRYEPEPDSNDSESEGRDDVPYFLTPQPPDNWSSGYDAWITFAGRALGMDAPEPILDPTCYEQELAAATTAFQRKIPDLRTRFLAGLGSLKLGLKVGLATRFGGMEYVWVRPVNWHNNASVKCILESQPRNCKGYKYGQELVLGPSQFLDYLIGSETTGIVERGGTQRIAENYGLII